MNSKEASYDMLNIYNLIDTDMIMPVKLLQASGLPCERAGDILASLGGPSTISTPHSFILNYETLLYFLAPGSQHWGSDRQTPKMSRASCQGDGASTSACSKPSQDEEDRQLFNKEKSAGD